MSALAPVQQSGRGHVVMKVAEAAYGDAARSFHGQTLARMNERGGLSWAELVFHLYRELLVARGEPLTDVAFYDLIEMER